MTNRSWHDAPWDRIQRRYEEGLSTYDLWQEFGVPANVIGSRLRRAGVTRDKCTSVQLAVRQGKIIGPRVYTLSADNEQRLVERYRDGESAHALARSYGMPYAAVRAVLTARGERIRTRSEAQRMRWRSVAS